MTTVLQFANRPGCTTAGLRPLNEQILEILLNTINTEEETNLLPCDDIPLLEVVGNSTIPLLQPAARASLQHVIELEDRQLNLVHAFRTIAQQYVLREWHMQDRCVVSARKPGRSDHERGLAIDINGEDDAWIEAFTSNGWHRPDNDPGHFNYLGDDVNPIVLPEAVKSFQKLWNRNNPNDLIDEDGVYGDIQTGPRLRISPIEGFPIVF